MQIATSINISEHKNTVAQISICSPVRLLVLRNLCIVWVDWHGDWKQYIYG